MKTEKGLEMKIKLYNDDDRENLRKRFEGFSNQQLARWLSIVFYNFDYSQLGKERMFEILEAFGYDHSGFIKDAMVQIWKYSELPPEEQDAYERVKLVYTQEGEKESYRKYLEEFHENLNDKAVQILALYMGAEPRFALNSTREEIFDWIENESGDFIGVWEEIMNNEEKEI